MTTHLDPQEALRLINEGALLIDVREPDEHARERIPNAKLVPLSRLTTPLDRNEAQQLIFHCRSGSRTGAAAEACGCRRRRCLHFAWRTGCLESGRAAGSKRPPSTDRNDAAGSDRRRQPRGSWRWFGRAAASGILRPVGVRRRRSGLCRDNRDMRHGPNARACSVEPNGSGLTGSAAGP